LLECAPAWDGNWTWDGFVAFAWHGTRGERLIVAVNYAGKGPVLLRLPFADPAGRSVRFKDLMADIICDRAGSEVASRGLYLDLTPWEALKVEIATRDQDPGAPGRAGRAPGADRDNATSGFDQLFRLGRTGGDAVVGASTPAAATIST